MAAHSDTGAPQHRAKRRDETLAFLLLTLVLFPVLSVILVGGFGFAVWMQHLMFGPPVH